MSGSICILYGLNEGPAMGRAFAAACRRAGFDITRDPAEADVIFAHSGGCLLVPPKSKAKLIVIAGLPYWPGRPWFARLAVKVWRDFQLQRKQRRLRQWGRKWTYHLRYALNLRAGLRMAANLAPARPWNSPQRQVVLRNRYDAICSPQVLGLPFGGPRTFISLPGEHDDCWDNPGPYINLIQSLL